MNRGKAFGLKKRSEYIKELEEAIKDTVENVSEIEVKLPRSKFIIPIKGNRWLAFKKVKGVTKFLGNFGSEYEANTKINSQTI